MKKQQGFTFWSLSFTVGTIVTVALVAMKLFPAYSEFMTIKKAIVKISQEPDFRAMSRTEIIKAFDRTSAIDDIKSVKAEDLEITKDGSGGNVVSAEYQVVVPMVANISFLLDFYVSTDESAASDDGSDAAAE